jgi:Ca-activated chloride channel family protein
MLNFDRPVFLFLVLLVPLFFVLRKSGILKHIEFPLTLGDWNGLPVRWSSPMMKTVLFVSRVASVASFTCMVVAIAGPVRFLQERVYTGNGTAIIFALDVSPSMAARDMGSETRLDTARSFIHAFTAKRPGDSFGLVALGSDAALLVPPTVDHVSFNARLDSLAIGELGDGTALGLGLAVAAAHLINRSEGHSCVILLTDGENNSGEINPVTAAGVYTANSIRLFIVGVGSRGEVPLEYTDPETGKQYSGLLDSSYNEGALRSIADRGGGTFVSAASHDALAEVFAGIGNSVPSGSSSFTRTIEQPLERPVVLSALALFALVWFIRRLVMGDAS